MIQFFPAMLQERQRQLPKIVPYPSELQRVYQNVSRTNNKKYMNKYKVMKNFNLMHDAVKIVLKYCK